MELDLNALQHLPAAEGQSTAGNPLEPDCGYTCSGSCTFTCGETN
jgi:hypothetical protein